MCCLNLWLVVLVVGLNRPTKRSPSSSLQTTCNKVYSSKDWEADEKEKRQHPSSWTSVRRFHPESADFKVLQFNLYCSCCLWHMWGKFVALRMLMCGEKRSSGYEGESRLVKSGGCIINSMRNASFIRKEKLNLSLIFFPSGINATSRAASWHEFIIFYFERVLWH